jgi:acetoin utilization deacetylase AcuC-like enzyme
MSGQVRSAYALTRPPGHHAEPGRAMGFCVFANAGLAAAHAISAYGLERVAIVDWDVHFGNGTYGCFADRRDVLSISIHQEAGYPLVNGTHEEIGVGPGQGYSLNIPLHAGGGDGAYRDAFERVILPALEAYRPQLIVVPCGFDAGRTDPLGRMCLDGLTFRWMTEFVMDVADRYAEGRLLFTHEGGYCPAAVPFFGLSVLETLSGETTEVRCPITALHEKITARHLTEWQRARNTEFANYFAGIRDRYWA